MWGFQEFSRRGGGNARRPALYFYRNGHDGVRERLMDDGAVGGGWQHIDMAEMHCLDVDGCGLVRALEVTDMVSVENVAEQLCHDINTTMLDARPDSNWKLICPTNIRIYVYLLDFAGGFHIQDATPPNYISQSPYVLNAVPQDQRSRQLCLFWCIARHFQEKKKREG